MSPKKAGNIGQAVVDTRGLSVADAAENDSEITDQQLVTAMKKGEAWASERLIRKYYQKARALAFQMCDKNAEEADDAVQQGFLNALSGIYRFQENASFKTWFYRILINTCRDMRRRRRRWLSVFTTVFSRRNNDEEVTVLSPDVLADEKQTANPDQTYHRHELNRDIQKALQILPDQQRMVFQLKMIQELSIPEISEILALAPGTVKSHLFRATQHMRSALAEWAGR